MPFFLNDLSSVNFIDKMVRLYETSKYKIDLFATYGLPRCGFAFNLKNQTNIFHHIQLQISLENLNTPL